jgi:hypothetical protein
VTGCRILCQWVTVIVDSDSDDAAVTHWQAGRLSHGGASATAYCVVVSESDAAVAARPGRQPEAPARCHGTTEPDSECC